MPPVLLLFWKVNGLDLYSTIQEQIRLQDLAQGHLEEVDGHSNQRAIPALIMFIDPHLYNYNSAFTLLDHDTVKLFT